MLKDICKYTNNLKEFFKTPKYLKESFNPSIKLALYDIITIIIKY